MDKYTYENLVINPEARGLEDIIGKEVYYNDTPIRCIDRANENYPVGILKEIHKHSYYPFCVETPTAGMVNFTCIIPKKEEPYEERAKRWIKENGLKKGDYVKVVRKAKDYEDGWDSRWTKERDDFIGKVIPVSDIGESTGVILSYCCCDWAGYDFPYFVLEKVEPEPKYVPFENAEEFLDAYYHNETENLDGVYHYLATRGIWLKDKSTEVPAYCMVTEVRDNGVIISDKKLSTTGILIFNNTTSWSELYESFTFLDGTLCGRLEESK